MLCLRSYPDSPHWRRSSALNRLLGGAKNQPLCARINNPVYHFVMDIIFREYQHCRRIKQEWIIFNDREIGIDPETGTMLAELQELTDTPNRISVQANNLTELRKMSQKLEAENA